MLDDFSMTESCVPASCLSATGTRSVAKRGTDRFQPPKSPISHRDAHDLVLGLVRRWLAEKAPPRPAREVVLEVKPAPERAATISDQIT
jgi:hypothetical protein